MAVITYGPGDHPTGWQGHRVDTTVGGERICEYYQPHQKTQADRRDKELRRAAEAFNKWKRVNGPLQPGQIAVGLSCSLRREQWVNDNGNHLIHTTPLFRVSMGRGKSKEFRIHVHGYVNAFRKSVSCYVYYHRLDKYRQTLLERIPDPDIFLNDLAKRAMDRGVTVSLSEVRDCLSLGGCDL